MKEAGTISLGDDTKKKRQPVPPSEEAMAEPKVNKTIDAVVAAIQKKFGSDAIYRFDERAQEIVFGTFSSGIAEVDEMIDIPKGDGFGGFPLGKLVQISGKESVGKSSFCKWLIGQAQAQGIICYFIDAEMSPDSIERAKAYGVDVHSLMWSEVLYIEDAFELIAFVAEKFEKSETPVLVFLDSVAAADMKSSKDRGFDEQGRRAEKASFLSANLPKLLASIKNTKVGLIFINQMRTTANATPYSDPDYEPGGRALAHYSQLVVRMTRTGNVGSARSHDGVEGIKARLRVKKSKVGRPFRESNIEIMFNGEVRADKDAR